MTVEPTLRLARCLWCDQPVVFIQNTGWVHPDGDVLRKRDELDDHYALPIRCEVAEGGEAA